MLCSIETYLSTTEHRNMKNTIEANLRAEIDFWRSLVNDWENTRNEPVHSRIEEALALAEYKLQQYTSANAKINLH